ncbi:MAG: replication-relaxation family protein [Chloroflexi bacterium]|nr:replication-relaxation family protein [Chloroflexota bacterium]
MTSSIPEANISRWLLKTPLASPREIACFMGASESTVYRAIRELEVAGFVSWVLAGSPEVPLARRYWLTPSGIRNVALADGTTPDELLKSYPISREWLQVLLRRLDSVISIYQVAAAVADIYVVEDFRWYRRIPLDAALQFDDGEWVAIHREGALATLFHRRRRIRTLAEGGIATPMLVMVPDSVRQRDWLRRLNHARGAIAVEEQFLADPRSQRPIWLSTDARFKTLEEALTGLGSSEAPARGWYDMASSPVLLTPATDTGAAAKNYELPLLLTASEKQVLNLIAAWPLMTIANAADFLGVTRQAVEKSLRTPRRLGLLNNIIPAGRREVSLALSNRGLLMLAKRDRLPTQHVLHHWSVARSHSGPFSASDMRGSRMRPLLRAKTHTSMVTGFFASLHRHAREQGGILKDVESFHRSWRGYADEEGAGGQLRPDGYGVYESNGTRVPFFLEWERRADRWSRYVGKLRPYMKYYRSGRAFEDAGDTWPFVLMVLRVGPVEDEFWQAAMSELRSEGLAGHLRILTTTEGQVLLHGPHRAIWRLTPNPLRSPLPRRLPRGAWYTATAHDENS